MSTPRCGAVSTDSERRKPSTSPPGCDDWSNRASKKEFPDLETYYALQPEPPDSPAATEDALRPDPNKPPVEGWTPRKLDRGWCAVLEGDQVAQLPDSDQLPGTPIIVTDRRGDSWTATLKAVVSRSDTEIVVTNTRRPRR